MLFAGIVGLLAGCGASGGSDHANSPSASSPGASSQGAAAASCAGLTASQQFKAASVVFDGTMRPGPTVVLGGARILSSPAVVRVSRYLKGRGPSTVRVKTAAARGGSSVAVTEDGIEPRAGQRWRIYSDGSREPLTTSLCGGSRMLGARAPAAGRVQSAAGRVPLGAYVEFAPHVASQLVITGFAKVGPDGSLAPRPGDRPLPASDFARPVAAYRVYAATQLKLMAGPLRGLEAALSENDRKQAKRAWEAAYARYLHLGAVYLEGPIATLNERVDGSPGGLPGGTASPRFTGLHRIEFGLWTGAAPDSLVGWARQLSANVGRLRALVAHISISPLDYATRAHEILEDAARDQLSGADVPWSQQGVLGTAAALAATRAVVATLRPLVDMGVVDTELIHLNAVINSLVKAHGGTLPANTQLSQEQSEALAAAVGQALEALALVPPSLDTTRPPSTSTIPARDVEIDP